MSCWHIHPSSGHQGCTQCAYQAGKAAGLAEVKEIGDRLVYAIGKMGDFDPETRVGRALDDWEGFWAKQENP